MIGQGRVQHVVKRAGGKRLREMEAEQKHAKRPAWSESTVRVRLELNPSARKESFPVGFSSARLRRIDDPPTTVALLVILINASQQ